MIPEAQAFSNWNIIPGLNKTTKTTAEQKLNI